MHGLGRKDSALARRVMSTVAGFVIVAGSALAVSAPADAAVTVTRVLVDVDFTTATMSGSTITNDAADKTDDLTVSGSPTGLGTATGLTFSNTTNLNTDQYLTGNLGNTSVMSEIVVEFVGKFTDGGCAAQTFGSMVFGLGTASSFIPYNIYRHSNFLGFNTFSSDLYGITLPDTTSYHSYKFVMRPGPSAQNSQEIWVDGVKQSLSQKTTAVPTASCDVLSGSENMSNRVFTGGSSSYTDGSFMLMSHPLLETKWGTTGSLKNIRITTSDTYVEPGAPVIDSVTPSDNQLSVDFTAPASTGGSDITDYKYSIDDGATWVSASSTSSPLVITGLAAGTPYHVKIRAVNIAGQGTPSAAYTATTTGTFVGPTAPLVGDVVVGDGRISVFFSPPSDDAGSTIVDYEYSTDNGGTWASAGTTTSPIVIRGLDNGTEYSVQIRAVNLGGAGTPSTVTSVTPEERSGSNSALAQTGADIQVPGVIAFAAIAFGLALLTVGRRSRRS